MLMALIQANYLNLFNWVLTTSAKASIFIVFLLGAKFVLRHRMGARLQYMLWLVLIIGLVLPWTPSSPVSIYNLVNSTYIQQVIAPISKGTIQPTSTVINTKPASVEQTVAIESNSSKAVLGKETPLTSRNNEAPFAIFPFIFRLMFLTWLFGILILTLVTIRVNIHFSNKIEHNVVTDPRLITVFNQLKAELNIKAVIPLVKTRHVNSPSLLGFIHPRLLLPIGIEQAFSLEQIKHIFLHELLHFKRKDILTNWLAQVLVIIHWFNPLIWYAFHRMREDQEIACDALAMNHIDTQQFNDYAYTLIKLVEIYAKAPKLASMASLSGSKSQIKRRLTMINLFRKTSLNWSLLVVTVVVALAFVTLSTATKASTPTTGASLNKPLEAQTGTTQTEVQKNKITRNGWDLSVEKIVIDAKSDVSKGAVVYFLFKNNNGLDKGFTPTGRIQGLVGTSGKIYEMSWNKPVDETYTNSKASRKQYDEAKGIKFEPGKFGYAVHLMVDGNEENFIKVIYEDGNGSNKVEIPIRDIVPEIPQNHNAK